MLQLCEHLEDCAETEWEYTELIHLVHDCLDELVCEKYSSSRSILNAKSMLFTVLRTEEIVNMQKCVEVCV